MSKVIAGLSEEDAITFSSRKSKITIHFDGRIEYKEVVKTNKENKLDMPLSLVYILIFILEFLLSLLVRYKGLTFYAVEFGTIFGFAELVRTINAFSSRESTKRNHAAEHMVYNANRNGVELTLDNVKKSKVFCEYCGSCFVANMVWLILLNIPIAIFTKFWIPYSLVIWIARNLPKGLPLNPFTHLVQKFLTAKPNDFNLFISMLAMNMVKAVDIYKEKFDVYDMQAAVAIIDLEVEKLVSQNDFDFDTSNLKTIFNPKNGGLWPPFFFLVKVEFQKKYAIIFLY